MKSNKIKIKCKSTNEKQNSRRQNQIETTKSNEKFIECKPSTFYKSLT